jgi:hypothetical protein
MPFPRVEEIIEIFKAQCRGKGWKIYGKDDVVDTGKECHHFVWAQHLHPKTFKKVMTNHHFPVREKESYRIVNVSYIAWISPEPISEKILEIYLEVPDLVRRAAVYDVSSIYRDKLVCLRMNETDSVVFQEFERLLREKYKIKIVPLHRSQQTTSKIQTIA